MSNVLKFPDLTSPSSDREINKLLKLLNKMNNKEEESSKATLEYFDKLMKFINHEAPLTKKEKKDLIIRQKKYYYDRLMKEMVSILENKTNSFVEKI
jgi:hypothetical protein